jgi:hypothetical protein
MLAGKDHLRFLEGRQPVIEDTFPCIGCRRPLPKTSSSSICPGCTDPRHPGFVRGRYTE